MALRKFGPALLLAGVLCLPGGGFSAEDAAAKARELEALRTQIETLQKKLTANQKKKSRAEHRLHNVERKINELSRTLRAIDRDLVSSREQLGELRDQQQDLSGMLNQQRKRLAAEARAAYAMGRQQQVKLLLNQEQPSTVGRMLAYFGYFSRARTEQIVEMRLTLERLQTLEQSIGRKTESLALLRDRQQEESGRLQDTKKARKRVISQLSSEMNSQGGELKRLKGNELELQELVYSLQELLADIPTDASQQQPFKVLKGKLRWPARGRLIQRFGTQRGSGGLKWQGVVISAPEGGDIRAISQGRVAFADWMRGFGLLVIIDHGDGYMSLYGHNQALYKEVGEWVDTGEVVAALGASGGQARAGLYFELRHKGRPINPLRWCRGKPAAVSG